MYWPMATGCGCWVWGGKIDKTGYGRVLLRGGRSVAAHRYFYEIERGRIPEGLDLDHLCRKRNCVNPWHMEAVTRRENISRGAGSMLRRGKTSRYVGVHFYSRTGKWQAKAYINGRKVHIGYFATESDAALAYQSFIFGSTGQ